MLELGQCATPMPRSAKKARSSASSMQQCANQQSFSSHPISLCHRPDRCEGVTRMNANIQAGQLTRPANQSAGPKCKDS